MAVVGASDRDDSLGKRVFRNIATSGFQGPVYAVNPGHRRVQQRPSYPSVTAIEEPVDVAVVTTRSRTLPNVLEECGEKGIRAVCILSSGFRRPHENAHGRSEELIAIARRHDIRLIGPDCMGLLRPGGKLNLSDCRSMAHSGQMALISQSSALCNAILDWADQRQIGFSTVLGLGDALDVDFGDVLDFLATDASTRSILLYVEAIHNARRFMSGLRAAARIKPVIVMKAGRHRETSPATLSHTGALVGADDVFEAALARAGAVRVFTVEQLFSAAQVLSCGHRVRGNRLAILTNGAGPGIIATDRALELGMTVPPLGEQTRKHLETLIPSPVNNPVDLRADAGPERYAEAAACCLEDRDINGIVALLSPHARTQPAAVAESLLKAAEHSRKPVLASWLGDTQVRKARDLFQNSRVPHFDTPEAAVEAFSHLAHYHRNQQLLLQVPGPMSVRQPSNIQGARLIIEAALEEGRHSLSSMESKALLTAFGIPVVRTVEAHSASEALVVAESLGYPVAMKISSPDIAHKSRIGGVRLNIGNAQAVRAAYTDLIVAAQSARPGMNINRVTLERMHNKPSGRELIVGVAHDPVFGPVISFGAGGTLVELIRDRSVALPPLNTFIARDLILRTRISQHLKSDGSAPAVDMRALEDVLLRVSDLVSKLPHVRELDINPLVLDETGALAVDAFFSIEKPQDNEERYGHMAIHPYPTSLVGTLELKDGTQITVRPIRPEDAEAEQAFVHNLSQESKYFRFMETLNQLTPQMLVRLTQIDYDREMALVALHEELGREEQIGVARYTLNPDGESCEFALAIADAWQHRGVGRKLMEKLMETAADRGIQRIEGDVLSHNRKMLKLMQRLNFDIRTSQEDYGVKHVSKSLQESET
ncbi:bifunctional acetate--CoA ligase family protein/GNAT family N-acetyltransferase [Alkalilimnicola ehrlichii]|uniref:bifunctional acetate--CoA ligase family protein/GNAT family N-acetyltransferase n=1 Tax=Alkalilimnicola ehrlichii TaxID=351052 RepID=UPI000E2E536D|nr:bifunctional acetate--CoA ligase family protein/GNAT family N-acetyltransferase [Alkalilimnicola ehrlichii]